MYLYHLNKAFFCQISNLINLYMSATTQLENIYYYEMSLENKNLFSISYLASPSQTLTLNDMLNDMLNVKYIYEYT